MTISVTHTTQAVGTDAGNGEIRKAQWNEAHTLSMATGNLLGRTTAGAGAVEEIAVGSGLALSGGVLQTQGLVQNTGGTASNLSLTGGYTEGVYAVSGTTPALSPTNGSIQTWALTGNSTPTVGTWASGQSITLMVDDGTAYTITWTSMAITWKTDSAAAPTLNTTGYTVIQLWKVGTVMYGARVGNA